MPDVGDRRFEDGVTETLPGTRPSAGGGPAVGGGARFAPGTVVAGRYRVVALLGKGGMGEVYRAEDLRLGETVALKFLPPEVAEDRAEIERMVAEVRVGRKVSHPNVCRVHDLVESDGRVFLSMEYVDGEDLASLLSRIGRLPPAKALELARDLCRGLAAIHDQGVVHRDLKPQNVMVDGRGRARITDFGLAVPASDVASRGAIAGTLLYMAPEQLRGADASVRTDVYALGLVVYEMLSGRHPFPATTLEELARRRAAPAPALHEVTGQVEPGVERLVLRCLAEEPSERPASAPQVLAGLPGGDALAAALAAGETPSPELVAAASQEGLLKPVAGWLLFLGVVAGLAGTAALADRTQLARRIGLPKPPAALAARAEDTLVAAGLPVPTTDQAIGFFRAEGPPLRHGQTERLVPSALRAFFRASPSPLDAWQARFFNLYLVGMSRLGHVTVDDPPPAVPGEVIVVLDPAGRLVELRRVAAPGEGGEGASATAVEETAAWEALLAATGVGGLVEATPQRAPPVGADSRRAWRGVHPAGEPVVIEGAAFQGRPVWLRVFGPAELAAAPPAASRSGGSETLFATCGIVVFLVSGVSMVRRHLRLRRGDRSGAFRLAVAAFSTLTVAGLFRVRHQPEVIDEMLLVGTLLSQTFFCAFLAWLTYLAVEPYVRRRWPLNLVSWTRLISGRLRDPMVGRDLLLGLLAGLVGTALIPLAALLEERLGISQRVSFVVPPSGFADVRHTLYYLLYLPYPAILNALGFLLFLVLLRVALRRTVFAVAALGLLIAVPIVGLTGAPALSPTTLAGLAASGLLAVTVLRLGLLSTAAALFVFFLVSNVPLTLDPSAWYFGRSATVLALLAAASGVAFYSAVGGRLGFGGELLDDVEPEG